MAQPDQTKNRKEMSKSDGKVDKGEGDEEEVEDDTDETEDALGPMKKIPVWIIMEPRREDKTYDLSPPPQAHEADCPTPYPALPIRVYLNSNRLHWLQDDIAFHIGYSKEDIDWSTAKWRRHTAHRSSYRLVGESAKEWLDTANVWTRNINKWKAITLSITLLPSEYEQHSPDVNEAAHGPRSPGFNPNSTVTGMNYDIWHMIFSIVVDYPKEPQHTDHPIHALALLRCRPYAYPTDEERKRQRVVLSQVCKSWRWIIDLKVDTIPQYPYKNQDLYQLVHDNPMIVTLRLTQLDWSHYTMAQLSIDAPAIQHIIIAPLMEEYRPTNFLIKMNMLTTLSMEFGANGLPFEQWHLPSLRTFGLGCYDQTPGELQSLLRNVGTTITTLSYEVYSDNNGTQDAGRVALAVPEDIWVWCPLMLNLRISARNFSVLRPPPTRRKPLTIYLIDFDIAIGAAGLDSERFHQQVADWGQALDKVSFGTTWSTFFSKMTRVDSFDFKIFMRELGQNRCRMHDREGVSSEDIEMERRFERASEIYRHNKYY